MANTPVLRITGTDNGGGRFYVAERQYKAVPYDNQDPVKPEGEVAVNSTQASLVDSIFLSQYDNSGELTKTISKGDVIELGKARFTVITEGLELYVAFVPGYDRFFVEDVVYDLVVYPATGVTRLALDEEIAARVSGDQASLNEINNVDDKVEIFEKKVENITGRVSDLEASETPVGTVVMYFGTSAPTGWFVCDGRSFDISTYTRLHDHLKTVPNYISGKMPDFKGLYPGGAGSGRGNNLTVGGLTATNTYFPMRTAQPSGGPPTSQGNLPDGGVRGFTATGNTNAYSDSAAQVSIPEGWDVVTRGPTLTINFIMKD